NCPEVMSPDGNLLMNRKLDGVDILDTATGKIRASYSGELGFSCVFTQDSKILAIAGRPNLATSKDSVHGVRLVDTATGKLISLIKTDHPFFWLFAFSRDGRMLATGHKDA